MYSCVTAPIRAPGFSDTPSAVALAPGHNCVYCAAPKNTAPGLHARLLVSAAIRNFTSPLGVGSMSVPPTPVCCSWAICCDTTTHPPWASRCSASAADPLTTCEESTLRAAPGGRAISHARRPSMVTKPPAKICTRAELECRGWDGSVATPATPGSREMRLGRSPALKSTTAWSSPRFPTHNSASPA